MKQINKLTCTSLNNQYEPSQQPLKNLWGKKINIYGLDTANRQFANTTEDKFQYQ